MRGAVTQGPAIADQAGKAADLTQPLRLPWGRIRVASVALVVLAAAAVFVSGLLDTTASEPVVVRIPGSPTGLVASGETVWVSAAGVHAVWPIDPATARQAGPGIRTGGAPSRLAVGGEGLWVADNARGAVIPVGTSRRRVYDAMQVGADVTDVELAAGAVWVASSAEDTVRAIEPDGGDVHRLRVGGDPVDLAADGRWVVAAGAGDGTVTRIDARSRRAAGAPVDVGGVPVAVAVSGDTAWVVDSAGGTVTSVDLAAGRAGASIEVGRRPVAVAADGDEVWVLCRGDRTLVRVDGRDGEVLSRQELEVAPSALALDDRYVWVAASADEEVLRIAR
jgi:DNA-binding beta-propeller fold protein YncE